MNDAATPTARTPASGWNGTSPATSLRISNSAAPAVTGVAIRKLNSGRGRAIEAEEQAGRDRDPRPADPGHERGGLGDADPERARNGEIADAAVAGAPAIGEPEDRRADEQHHRDEPDGADFALDDVVEEDADDGGRDDCDEQQDEQPPVGVARDRPLADERNARRGEPEPVGAEIEEQCEQRPDMEHHRERQRADERVAPAEHGRHDDQVARARDRQELGHPLHDAEDEGLDEEVHRRL